MRVVSLVPSLTLTIAELGLEPSQLVGRTPWCIHPESFVRDVQIIGGTKTPNINKIRALNPDLVILDREENPKEFYDELVSLGIETYVSTVEHPRDVPEMLVELGRLLNLEPKAIEVAEEIRSELMMHVDSGPVVLPMIWHEPLMAVAPTRYAGALLECCGFIVPNLDPRGNGYPVVTPEAIESHNVEGLLLSSEPHEFSKQEGEAICDVVESLGGKRPWTRCVDGEALTWFGTHTLDGLRAFTALCKDLKTANE